MPMSVPSKKDTYEEVLSAQKNGLLLSDSIIATPVLEIIRQQVENLIKYSEIYIPVFRGQLEFTGMGDDIKSLEKFVSALQRIKERELDRRGKSYYSDVKDRHDKNISKIMDYIEEATKHIQDIKINGLRRGLSREIEEQKKDLTETIKTTREELTADIKHAQGEAESNATVELHRAKLYIDDLGKTMQTMMENFDKQLTTSNKVLNNAFNIIADMATPSLNNDGQPQKIKNVELLFTSIGSLLLDNYEAYYKQLQLNISALLDRSHPSEQTRQKLYTILDEAKGALLQIDRTKKQIEKNEPSDLKNIKKNIDAIHTGYEGITGLEFMAIVKEQLQQQKTLDKKADAERIQLQYPYVPRKPSSPIKSTRKTEATIDAQTQKLGATKKMWKLLQEKAKKGEVPSATEKEQPKAETLKM